MTRVKSSTTRHKRTKKILERAKGFRGARSKLSRTAREAVMRALAASYRDRKKRKRNFRALWIIRIRAGVKAEGMSYSVFMNNLKKARIKINRKILAELAVHQPDLFSQLVRKMKNSFSEP